MLGSNLLHLYRDQDNENAVMTSFYCTRIMKQSPLRATSCHGIKLAERTTRHFECHDIHARVSGIHAIITFLRRDVQ